MGFVHSFGGAKMILKSIKSGSCVGRCRSGWLKNIKYALKTSSNPLKLTTNQRKELKEMIKEISNKRIQPSKKVLIREIIGKYYNPNKKRYQYKKKRGKDKQMYISLPDSKGKFQWKLYTEKVKLSLKSLKKTVKKETSKKLKKNTKKQIKKNRSNRPSPSESATLYCGKKKKGNDGNMYLSKPNKNGVCRWIKIK